VNASTSSPHRAAPSTTGAGGRPAGPVVRWIALFGAQMGAFYALFYLLLTRAEGAYQAFLNGMTWLAVRPLLLFDVPLAFENATIVTRGGVVEVVSGCDGLAPAAMFAAATLATPVRIRARLVGVLLGLTALLLANLARIATLAMVQWKAPAWFDFAHASVGQTAYALLAFGLWALWCALALPKQGRACLRADPS